MKTNLGHPPDSKPREFIHEELEAAQRDSTKDPSGRTYVERRHSRHHEVAKEEFGRPAAGLHELDEVICRERLAGLAVEGG